MAGATRDLWIQWFIITNSGWDCSNPNKFGAQLGSPPELMMPAGRAGGSHDYEGICTTLYPYLDPEALNMVTHSLVISQLYFCNALLEATLEEHLKVSAGAECSRAHSF